ncbi:MAG: DUF6456 domain-containing protein [Sphingomonadales bacterium]
MTLAQSLKDQRLPGSARVVTMYQSESPLAWLRSRGLVSLRQFAAGELLRADYESAALGPRVTMRWDASGVKAPRSGSSAPDLSAPQLSAKARFDAALANAGSGLADILWRIICAGETIPDAERALAWPARSGRLVVTLALDRVADYYRVP